MRCDEARDRLVALEDHELSRSEASLVRDHLKRCPRCTAHQEALAALRIAPFLAPPAEVWQRLDRACEPDRLWQRAHAPMPRPAPHPALVWLRQPVAMSQGAVMAWAAVLFASLTWGASAWFAPAPGASPAPGGASEIPADHYRPASYVPEDDAVFP